METVCDLSQVHMRSEACQIVLFVGISILTPLLGAYFTDHSFHSIEAFRNFYGNIF